MIKKTLILALAFIIGISGISYAKDECSEKYGGYIASQADIPSVKEVANMADGSYVTLQGNISKRLTKEMYQFTDSSGSIMLKMDKKVWHGQTINAKDTVQIFGKVDKEKDKTIIKVKNLIKV